MKTKWIVSTNSLQPHWYWYPAEVQGVEMTQKTVSLTSSICPTTGFVFCESTCNHRMEPLFLGCFFSKNGLMGNTKEPLGTKRLSSRVPCRTHITVCQLLTGHLVGKRRNESQHKGKCNDQAGAGTKSHQGCAWKDPAATSPWHNPPGSATHQQGKLRLQALTTLHS